MNFDSTEAAPSGSTTFNGQYNDVHGNQDSRHNRNFGTIHSAFTAISGDQIDSRNIVYHGPIINVHAGTTTSRESLQNTVQDIASALSFAPASNGPHLQIQSCQKQAMMAAADASDLMMSIVLLLADSTESFVKYRDFLRSLNIAMLWTKQTLKTFEFTPLGRNLANTIKPTILACRVLLQELFDKLCGYRESLSFSIIWDLWSLVMWSGSEAEEIFTIKSKLSGNQTELWSFLAALNSYVRYTL